MLMCELNRVASHLLFFGTMGLDVGAMTPVMYTFRDREKIQSLFEAVSGARMMHNYIRIGGVKNDLPDDFSQHMARLIPEIKQGIDEADRLLSFSEIFLARTKGIGVIDAETAIANGMSGPSLRATGVPMDVRKDEPVLRVQPLRFRHPHRREGRLLGQVLRPRGGDAAVSAHHRAGDGPD